MRQVYLDVPYSYKDEAKQLGAKWNPQLKKWYVYSNDELELFRPWLPRFTCSPRLTIELVPRSCWYTNMRSNVSRSEWDRLRKQTYRQANNRCEICAGRGVRHPVECHEIWHYDDRLLRQTLVKLIALCPPCHHVKHIGLSRIQGRETEALEHLAKVNGWSSSQSDVYVYECFEIWYKRSQYQWELDISLLEQL